MSGKGWFDVDKVGLSKLMAGRGPEFIVYELLQNAWDQNVTRVDVRVEHFPDRVGVTVTDDDPDGFADLAHAYTLFAESSKKVEAEKRGRFNLGEKLVLALAENASISSTKGTVVFGSEGRSQTRACRDAGSCVIASFKLPKPAASARQMIDGLALCIPPVPTFVNGEALPERVPLCEFEVRLPTVIADGEGIMRPRVRMARVRVYEPLPGHEARVYEMGIPVVETGDRFDVSVEQKIPLTLDRDNVTPAFLRAVRVAVLNATHDRLGEQDVTATWVREASADKNADPDAVRATVHKRFGADAVIFDPSDAEANKIAQAAGRQVVYGGSLSKGEWANVRAAGILKPAGVVTPSSRPKTEEAARAAIPRDEWAPSMLSLESLCQELAGRLLPGNRGLTVMFCELPFNATGEGYEATFRREGSTGTLVFNLALCTKRWADGQWASAEILDLIVHEFGHWFASDHLSRDYYHGLSRLAGSLARLAVTNPAALLM